MFEGQIILKLKIHLILKISLFILVLFVKSEIRAQSDETKFFQFNGTLNLTSDFYSVNGIQARQPSNQQRLILRANLNFIEQIDIPIEVSLSNSDSRLLQPFNQFGLSPKITDWLTLHGGYFYSNLSDLTFGDIKILGGGVELTPGNFRFKAFYGRSRASRQPDSLQAFGGIYKQKMYAIKVGYGNESIAYLDLNFTHTLDDSSSITPISISQTPTENFVGSVSFGLRILEVLMLNGEAALAAYSNDIRSENISDINFPKFLFTPKTSSQFDGAVRFNIFIEPQTFWSLKMGTKWIGPGFITNGFAQLHNDLFEFTIDPYLRLFNSRLNLRSSIGIRTNNLRNNKVSKTNRFLGMLSADYQITDDFGLNFQYNNNQIKSTQYADSIKISNVLNMISLSPRYVFPGLGGNNFINLTYSYQNSEDSNPYYNNKIQNKTNSLNIIHTIIYPSSLNLTSSVLYNKVSLSNMDLTILSLNETIGYQFFDNKLGAYLTLGYSTIKVSDTNGMLVLGLRASYNLNQYGTINIFLTNNSFNSNDPVSPAYKELQGNLQYLINF